MGLREFLGIPKRHRRKKSKARSEIDPTGGTDEVELAPSRLTLGSTPDLQISASISTSAGPSTAGDQRSNGMQLVIFLDRRSDRSSLRDTDPPSTPDRSQSIPSKTQSKPIDSTNETSAVGGSKSDWKATASSAAKLLLLGVRESADAFGPLKSVAGGLCFILENCEVGTSFYTCFSQSS